MGAAVLGFTTWGVIDTLYSDPTLCLPDENALLCEFRIQKPSVALIMLGANDAWMQGSIPSEPYLRIIASDSVERGIIPILSTFAWNPKSSYYPAAMAINDAIRRVAADYDLPLWDFAKYAGALADGGIGAYTWDVHAHLSQGPAGAYVFTPANLTYGQPLHNLQALQALDTVWRYAMQP